jgi:PAS domain S-box-containing protein
MVGSRLADTLLILRSDGVITFANAPLGTVSADQAVGTSLSAHVLPAQRAVVEEAIRAVFEGREPPPCDLHGLLPQSQSRRYEVRFAPVSRNGLVAAAAAVIRDITERSEREDALRQERDAVKERLEQISAQASAAPAAPVSQASAPAPAPDDANRLAALCTLFDAVGEAAFVSDAGTGRLVEVNATACAWLRAPREQVLGRTGAQLGLDFPLRPDAAESTSITETRTGTRPVVVGGGKHRRRDRTAFAVEVSLTNHEIDGRAYVLAVARAADVSGRAQQAVRASEWFYRTLFDYTRDAVLLVARSGAIRHANSAALALFRYQGEDIKRLNLRDLMVESGDVERFRAGMKRDGLVRGLQVRLRDHDSRVFTGVLNAAARPTEEDTPIQGYQCIIHADLAAGVSSPEGASGPRVADG